MTHRIGTKGQVVIPKRLRDRRGLAAGAEVTFEEQEEGILIRREQPRKRLRGRYGQSGLAARLLEDRASEPR